MTPYRNPNDAHIDEAIAGAIAGENHALAGWLVGVTFTPSFLIAGAAVASATESHGIPWGAIVLALCGLLTPPLTILAVRALNKGIAERVRRMLTQGTRHEGTIVQARRVSMSQSRVIVQGPTFQGFEVLLSTGLSDAVLLNRTVEVFVHPQDPKPLLLPPR